MQTKFTKIKYEVHKNYMNLRFLSFEIAYHNVLGFKIFYLYTAFFFLLFAIVLYWNKLASDYTTTVI